MLSVKACEIVLYWGCLLRMYIYGKNDWLITAHSIKKNDSLQIFNIFIPVGQVSDYLDSLAQ